MAQRIDSSLSVAWDCPHRRGHCLSALAGLVLLGLGWPASAVYAQAPWQQPPQAQEYRTAAPAQWHAAEPAENLAPVAQDATEEPTPTADDFSLRPLGPPDGPGLAPDGCRRGPMEPCGQRGDCAECPPQGPCDGCSCPCGNRLWFRGEYLLWWNQGARIPPLLTTSPAGTSQSQAGVLGQPGTTILFGDDQLEDGSRNGGRITFGYWFGPCQDIGFQASYLGIGRDQQQFQAGSDGTTILARPFFNVETGLNDAELVAFPGLLQGTFTADSSNSFQAAEILLRRSLCRCCCYRVDFVAGYRFARLDDKLLLTENLVTIGGPTVTGTTFDIFDSFNTRNQFNGGEVGFITEVHRCRWSLETTLKVALGDTHSLVDINGQTTTAVPNETPNTYPGGLLALPSNIGQHGTDQLSVMPELGLTLGYDLTCRLRLTFGYTFLYWSSVARPGDQIDLDVSPSQLPPPTRSNTFRPAFDLRTSDYWAQGVNFGLDFRF